MPTTKRRNNTPPPWTGSNGAEVLRGFLDDPRAAIAAKVEGAPEPQVRTAAVPSDTNLLGPGQCSSPTASDPRLSHTVDSLCLPIYLTKR